jgi:hypothetical protein
MKTTIVSILFFGPLLAWDVRVESEAVQSAKSQDKGHFGDLRFGMQKAEIVKVIEKGRSDLRIMEINQSTRPNSSNDVDGKWVKDTDGFTSIHAKLTKPLTEFPPHTIAIHCYLYRDKLFKIACEIPVAYVNAGDESQRALSNAVGGDTKAATRENAEKMTAEIMEGIRKRYEKGTGVFINTFEFEFLTKSRSSLLPEKYRKYVVDSISPLVIDTYYSNDDFIVVEKDGGWNIDRFGPDQIGTKDYAIEFISIEMVEKYGVSYCEYRLNPQNSTTTQSDGKELDKTVGKGTQPKKNQSQKKENDNIAEEKANDLLKTAKRWLSDGGTSSNEIAGKKLAELLNRFPDSKAAKEGRELLEKLKRNK